MDGHRETEGGLSWRAERQGPLRRLVSAPLPRCGEQRAGGCQQLGDEVILLTGSANKTQEQTGRVTTQLSTSWEEGEGRQDSPLVTASQSSLGASAKSPPPAPPACGRQGQIDGFSLTPASEL